MDLVNGCGGLENLGTGAHPVIIWTDLIQVFNSSDDLQGFLLPRMDSLSG
jgi:hypothetical protein